MLIPEFCPGTCKSFMSGTEPTGALVLIPSYFERIALFSGEASHGPSKTLPRHRAHCRGRPRATRDDLPVARGERLRRHPMRKCGGRRVGAAKERWRAVA